jgi:alpha-glucosidase
MYDVLRFWLDRGVDGFRVDVLWLLLKDEALRDNPPNPSYQPGQAAIHRFIPLHNADQPEVHEVIAQMRRVIEEYRDRILIGEIYLPIERLVAYYGKDLGGAHLPFNFQLLQTAWTAEAIARLVREYEAALPPGGWPNWVLGNHDQKRIAARVGNAQARIAAMLLLTLRGTPTLYYGDELGMSATTIPPEAMQDPWEKNEPGLGLSRDPSRTPFQWDATANAGFTTGRPWLPLDPAYPMCNARMLQADSTSILTLYERLIATRQRHAALQIGALAFTRVQQNVLVYERTLGEDRVFVCLNFGDRDQRVSHLDFSGAEILLSTHLDRSGPISDLVLRANEGVMVLTS